MPGSRLLRSSSIRPLCSTLVRAFVGYSEAAADQCASGSNVAVCCNKVSADSDDANLCLMAQDWPYQAKEGVDNGHEVGVHTWSHRYCTALTNEQFFAELWYTRKMIKVDLLVPPSDKD